MNFFKVRRVRLRPEYAHIYPEVVDGVWLSARKVSRQVRKQGPRPTCLQEGCSRGRVLCELHFEFRGGPRGHQFLLGRLLQRVAAVVAMVVMTS